MSGSIWVPGVPAALGVTLAVQQLGNLGGTVTIPEAIVNGNLLYVQGKLVFTIVGTAANPVAVTMVFNPAYTIPAAFTNSFLPIGTFVYTIAATSVRHTGVVVLVGSNTIEFFVEAQNNVLGIAPAVTAAIGDSISFSIMVPLS